MRRARRRNPRALATPFATRRPRVGDRYSFALPGMYPFDVVVIEVGPRMAAVSRADPGGEPSPYGTKMPVESVAHFVNDLRGVVYIPPSDPSSGDPIVDVVLRGEATLLGKGDDGVVFRVDTPEGPLVVKVSTTVPFQPLNPNHLTPAEAVARLEAQQAASEAMAAAGVPGILPSTLVVHEAAQKAFLVKPYVEIPEHLSKSQLDEVAASVEAAHRAGWVFRDALQVGVWDGRVYHFDTGKAEYLGDAPDAAKRLDPNDYWSDAHTDVQNLKRLFSDNGARYLTEREKTNPIAEFESLYSVDVHSLTPEDRKKYRSLVLNLGQRIKTYLKNHPDEDNGLWSEIPEYAADEIRAMMDRFKEPT
mgnify:CR=1 FL=1